jgi:hypothetical protein
MTDTTVTEQTAVEGAAVQVNPAGAPEITANYDPLHQVRETKFSFRTIKNEETGVETKRPNVVVQIPALSVQGIIECLKAGGKPLDLLLDACYAIQADYARELLKQDETITTENFPIEKLDWAFIAELPDEDGRRGRGIAKEIWEDFYKDYNAVMVGLTGKTAKQVDRQASMFLQKLNPLKNHEDKAFLIPKLKEQLTIYANGSPNAEQFVECIDFLNKKADEILSDNKTANLKDNLGF